VGLRRQGDALGATRYAVLVVTRRRGPTTACSPRSHLLQAAAAVRVVVVHLLLPVISSVAVATAAQVLAVPVAALSAGLGAISESKAGGQVFFRRPAVGSE